MTMTYLKVKIKSLAAEAQIIRAEERVWKAREISEGRPTFFGLRHHRVIDVRNEARVALLAYGFIRGVSYARMEGPGTKSWPNWTRVAQLVAKYGAPAEWQSIRGNPGAMTKQILVWAGIADASAKAA